MVVEEIVVKGEPLRVVLNYQVLVYQLLVNFDWSICSIIHQLVNVIHIILQFYTLKSISNISKGDY